MLMRKIENFLFLIVFVLILSGCAATKKARIRAEKVDRVINTARSFTGTPYKWGGTTRAGMDCSGLVNISFQSAGVELPRTTNDLRKVGKSTDIYNLQPGDLVFFAMNKKKRRRITHVGIVTEVRGKDNVKFIHSSSSLGVVEANLMSRYYQGVFRKARRVM